MSATGKTLIEVFRRDEERYNLLLRTRRCLKAWSGGRHADCSKTLRKETALIIQQIDEWYLQR